MSFSIVDTISLLSNEYFSRAQLERTPEPNAKMDHHKNVRAFHEQGSVSGPLLPIYHFNALAISQLTPENGTLLDLGSGSGQFLTYLARMRPDISIIGFDLSPAMVTVGNESIGHHKLSSRISLKVGDMTTFSNLVDQKVDIISSIFSLHHLPTFDDLNQCLCEIGKIQKRDQSAVWIFDHTRPKNPHTADRFPKVFTPDAPQEFKTDSSNSLKASFSFKELTTSLNHSQIRPLKSFCSRFLKLYQVHRSYGDSVSQNQASQRAKLKNPLPTWAEKEFKGLIMLFPGVYSKN